MLDYTTYTKKVEELAFYPYAGENNVASLIYPVLGLNGEVTELMEKVDSLKEYDIVPETIKTESILYEMGDVLWYITRVADELETSLEEITNSVKIKTIQTNNQNFLENTIHMVIACGRIAEITKKTLRDDNGGITAKISETKKELILNTLQEVIERFIVLTKNFRTSMDDIAEMNVKKLESRRKRGTLNGAGDNR